MAKKDLSFLSSALIAHRGLHDNKVPENSLAAFGAAVRSGYIIELDVHLLADGGLAVFHDDNLERMCGANVDIKDLTVRKMRKYRLAGTEEKIPLLKDVLALIHGAVPVIVEVKYDAPIGETVNALVDVLDGYNGDFALKSFHPLIVRKLKRKFRNNPVGQLYGNVMFKDVSRAKEWAFRRIVNWSMRHSDFISVQKENLEDPNVELLRKFNKPILCWTICDNEERLEASKLADNCICEKIL